ncbi:hypothetical protein MRB53_028743 [Persea americana]|uniref:Uncharacterized protein n=1 Tax=Persea americana TaxID=3435 RepID=A0ACC2KGG0_PERAE|nr:hypothetical protein MRB53_028743 [Persea americana]
MIWSHGTLKERKVHGIALQFDLYKPRPHGRRNKLPAPDAEVPGSIALEFDIFDFMEKFANPSGFPTKEELIVTGRMDLAEAIAAQGGWFLSSSSSTQLCTSLSFAFT